MIHERFDYKRSLPRVSHWPAYLIVAIWGICAAQVGREDAEAAQITAQHVADVQPERMIVPVRRCPEQFIAHQSDFQPWMVQCVTIAQGER